MLLILLSLAAGQQSQSMGATEAVRTPPPSAVAPAAQPTPAPRGITEPATTAPRQICHNVQVTGSRFPIRQCRNAQQTEADGVEARDMLRNMQGARTMPVS